MQVVVRAAVLFAFMWAVMRAGGKRELAQMSPFELIVLVTMGDLVQQGITQEDMSVTGSVIAVSTIALLAYASSYVTFRFPRARRALDGVPTIVVRDGRFIDEALRRERLSVDEVLAAAREQGIADLREVRLGILEPEGHFSFLGPAGAPSGQNQDGAAV